MAWTTNLNAALNLNIANFVSGLNKASKLTNTFAASLGGYITGGIVKPLQKMNVGFKDVIRIAHGIIVAKAFYAGLNAIRQATSAVWEFSTNLEYARMAYSNLFGNTQLALNFINVLQDFAAKTPFTFQQSEEAARRLLAYGIQYKNVMYLMQGVLAASTVTGNPETVERVSRALGQIYTKGRLMNEEMRQLAEAGVPAYDILRQKLGLTQKQLQNLGREGIPAAKAINALIDGLNERFGDVSKMAVQTTTGIISNIKDNFLMLASGVFAPTQARIRQFLLGIADTLATAKSLFDSGGLGAVFEHFIPSELHSTVRLFIANVIALKNAIGGVVQVAAELVMNLLPYLIKFLNVILPVVTSLISVLTSLAQAFVSNQKAVQILAGVLVFAASAWLLFRAAALANLVLVSVIKVIQGLAWAIGFLAGALATSPIITICVLIAAALIAVAVAANTSTNSIMNFFRSISLLNGVDGKKILLPDSKKRAADLDKFNERLKDTSKGLEKVAGSAKKATKELMSFDEVFTLSDPDAGAGGGSGLDSSIEMPEINLDDIFPTVEDIGTAAGTFWENLKTAIGDKFVSAGIGAALGGLIGGAIGFAAGNPILGAQIGALAGAIIGLFWDEISTALGLSDIDGTAIGIGAAIGAVIGAIAGGPGGALIGVAIGGLIGWITSEIVSGFMEGDLTPVSIGIGTFLGAAIGLLAGGPVGAAIGAAVGALVGWIVDLVVTNWDAITGWLSQAVTDVGNFLTNHNAWGVAGATLLGPLGGFIGSIKDLVDRWPEITAWFTQAAEDIDTFFINMGTAIGDAAEDVGDWFSGIWEGITGWFEDLGTSIKSFGTDILPKFWEGLTGGESTLNTNIGGTTGNIAASFAGILANILTTGASLLPKLWEGIKGGVTTLKTNVDAQVNSIRDWWNGLLDKVKTVGGSVLSNLWSGIQTGATTFTTNINTKVNGIRDSFNVLLGKVKTVGGSVLSNLWNGIQTGATTFTTNINTKVNGIRDSFNVLLGKVKTVGGSVLSNLWSGILTGATTFNTNVNAKVNGIRDSFNALLGKVKTVGGSVLSNLWTGITGGTTTLKNNIASKVNSIRDWFNEILGKVKTVGSNILPNIWSGVSGATTTLKNNFSSLVTTITGWFGEYGSFNFLSKWRSIGDNIVDGIWAGVNNAKQWLKEKLSGFASWLPQWVKDALGISSPAKAMMPIGDFSVQGIGVGFERAMPNLLRKATTQMSTLKGRILEGMSGTYNSSMTMQAKNGILGRERMLNVAAGGDSDLQRLQNNGFIGSLTDAIAAGVMQGMIPVLAGTDDADSRRPLYVGTLIATEDGLRELDKKLRIVQTKEDYRRGKK